MQRFKSFDSTGVAPDGILYAGDLNEFEDLVAALFDLTQNFGVQTISVGESGLQVIRYGAGEARVTGALRTDGILRGLGGISAGAYTTAQRNAIGSGLAPFGLIILNTDNVRYELNVGTDGSRNWQPLAGDSTGAIPIGGTMDWPWDASSIPSNYALCYGQAISRSSFPALHALAVTAGYPWGNGDTSTTFNLPDYRGRFSAGKDNMGGSTASRITNAISGIIGTTLGASGGSEGVALATGNLPTHSHGLGGAPTVTGKGFAGFVTLGAGDYGGGSPGATFDVSFVDISVAIGSLAVGSTGSGIAHLNIPPMIVVNKIMRVS